MVVVSGNPGGFWIWKICMPTPTGTPAIGFTFGFRPTPARRRGRVRGDRGCRGQAESAGSEGGRIGAAHTRQRTRGKRPMLGVLDENGGHWGDIEGSAGGMLSSTLCGSED